MNRITKTYEQKEEQKRENATKLQNLAIKTKMENDLILKDPRIISELKMTHQYRKSLKKKESIEKLNALSKYDSKGFLKQGSFEEISGTI